MKDVFVTPEREGGGTEGRKAERKEGIGVTALHLENILYELFFTFLRE